MRVLAIHTASARLSLALAEGYDGAPDAKIVFSAEIDDPRDQGDFLLHQIDEQLKEQQIKYHDLDLLAAVTGPGSFTGIRIGLAALRGFALAADVLVAGVNSFDLLRASVPVITSHRLMVIESWREELYFQLNDQVPFNVMPQKCLARLDTIKPSELTLMGDAADKMAPHLPGAIVNSCLPTATDLARLMIARADLRAGDAMPFYLRPADVSLGKGNRQLSTAGA